MRLLLYWRLRLLLLMVGFTATPPVALFVAASASTMRLMLRHCWLWYWWWFPPWQWRKQRRGQRQTINRLWFALMLLIVSIVHSIKINAVFTLVQLFLVTPKKNNCSSSTKSVLSATSTNSNWTKLLASSSTSFLNTSARKLILDSPIKLPAYRIEWLNYKAIRFKVKRYLKKENKTQTIEKDVSYLQSKLSTIKIRNALFITVGKLDIDALTGIDELPQRKPKLIEFFSKLIYNQMSTFNVSLKRDEWYVLDQMKQYIPNMNNLLNIIVSAIHSLVNIFLMYILKGTCPSCCLWQQCCCWYFLWLSWEYFQMLNQGIHTMIPSSFMTSCLSRRQWARLLWLAFWVPPTILEDLICQHEVVDQKWYDMDYLWEFGGSECCITTAQSCNQSTNAWTCSPSSKCPTSSEWSGWLARPLHLIRNALEIHTLVGNRAKISWLLK